MGIAARIKTIRESHGASQREMARTLRCSLGALQSYETGKSIPGGNVLETIARLGYNVNWLLTGLGEMKAEPVNSDWWAERFKEIRGGLSIEEIVKKIGFPDQVKWIAEFQAIEDGKKEPSWGLLTVLSQELGISPEWMIDGSGPMLKSNMNFKMTIEIVRNIIELDEFLKKEFDSNKISPRRQAEIIASIYNKKVNPPPDF